MELVQRSTSTTGPEPTGVPVSDVEPCDSRSTTIAGLRQIVDRVRPVSLASEHLLPISPNLVEMFASGLRRGSTVVVKGGAGATSLALSLCAQATTSGLWLGCLNTQSLGWAAARELGVDLDHVVTVKVSDNDLTAALGAMVDVFDLVLFDVGQGLSTSSARKLAARARERGCVLLLLVERREFTGSHRKSTWWPDTPDATLEVWDTSWEGLDSGRGRLRSQQLCVRVQGRRGLSRERSFQIRLIGSGSQLPGSSGERVEERPLAKRAS